MHLIINMKNTKKRPTNHKINNKKPINQTAKIQRNKLKTRKKIKNHNDNKWEKY
jgi:hypothetical protein